MRVIRTSHQWCYTGRLQLFNPHLDFSGPWLGASIYARAEDVSGARAPNAPPTPQPELTLVHFEQTLVHSRLRNGHPLGGGGDVVSWDSTSLQILGDEKFEMSYRVRRRLEPETIAFESVTVKNYQPKWKWAKTPAQLEGDFHHSLDANSRMLCYGFTYYIRIDDKQRAEVVKLLAAPSSELTKDSVNKKLSEIFPELRDNYELCANFGMAVRRNQDEV